MESQAITKKRKIVKATKRIKESTVPAKVQNNSSAKQEQISREKAVKALESLLNVFSCSRDHQIVGRTQEEAAIRGFIETNVSQDKGGLLYVCGHPG